MTKPYVQINGLKIKFGLGCDGQVIQEHLNTLGEVTVGSQGFLQILEAQLGFVSDETPYTERLVQYHECLKSLDKDHSFYHRSFQEDSFAVARTLLQWRDDWYAAGWAGKFTDQSSPRLQAMAEVEKIAATHVSPGVGQRLQRILFELNRFKPAIESIELLEPIEFHGFLWKNILELLRDKYRIDLVIRSELQPSCQVENDLQALQNSLLISADKTGKSQQAKKYVFKNDGSVLILRGSNPPLTSLAIANVCQKIHQQHPDHKIALIAEREGYELNSAFEHTGLPWPGFSSVSPWRPVFQVLPLTFELMWQPLNPHILLQFLTHPIGPVPRDIREKLANIVSNEPGIGGDAWTTAIDKWVSEGDTPKAQGQRSETVRFWLESERYDPVLGMPCEKIIERAGSLANWLQGHISWLLEDSKNLFSLELYQAALSQANELQDVLKVLVESGSTKLLPREALRHVIENVRGSGTGLVDRIAQVKSNTPFIFPINTPAACCAPVDVSIWWNCQGLHRSIRYPWFPDERKALIASGVILLQEEVELGWLGQSWLRPILAAKHQLILVFHESATQRHPIWDQIQSLIENHQETVVDNWIVENRAIPSPVGKLIIGEERLNHKIIPDPSRWWQLPKGIALPKRETESYSSLDKFINSPYDWVLNYQARLRSGSLMAVNDDSQLKGTLAHKLYEQFFREHLTIDKITKVYVVSWVDQHLANLLEKSGAVLLVPGRITEKDEFLINVQRSLWNLIENLIRAKVKSISMEYAVEGNFVGGNLVGNIDLLVTNAEGKEAVVDIKWGGFKYRKESFEDETYLQLATYAQMRQQANKSWPDLAYFIIKDARLLALDTNYFPDALQVKPSSGGANTAALWQRVEQAWKWRREQMDRGLIEVTVQNTEPTDQSNGGDKCLVIPSASDGFNDYAVLTLSKEYQNG